MKGGIEKRLLIHAGEGGNVLYFLLFFMLVSAGMAIGRSSADALFLKRLGIEYLPVMYMVQSFVLSAVCLVYTAFADRIPAERFFRSLFGILIVLILGSWFVIQTSTSTLVYPAYYLIYEVSSELLLVHATLYMSQNMTTLQAKRLAPLVFAGAQTGTIMGGLTLVVAAPVIGTPNLILVWCCLLLAGSVALYIRHKRHGTSTHFRPPGKSQHLLQESLQQIQQGLKYTWSSSLLRASSLALFFMVIAFYILCYSVNRVYTQTFESEESLTRFFGLLTAVTSILALLLQLFVTNRAIKHFGVRTINLIFPWTTLASLAGLTMSFALPTALAGSLNKDTLMTAFRNPVRSMFFNVLPDYMQGRSRAISVAVVLPLALLLCGLLLVIMQTLGNPVYFLVPGLLAALAYLYSCKKMNDAYVSTLISTLKERLFLPSKHMYADLKGCSEEDMKEIMRGVTHTDTDVSIAFSRVLAGSFPDKASGIILERLGGEDNATADRYLKLLGPLEVTAHADELYKLADNGDAHLQASILHLLLEHGEQGAVARSTGLLDNDNPRLRAIAICAALRYPDAKSDRTVTAWRELLLENRSTRLAALDLIPEMTYLPYEHQTSIVPAYLDAFRDLLDDPAEETRIRTLHGMQAWKGDSSAEIHEFLHTALSGENPELREAATRCMHLARGDQREALLLQAIGDANPRVRQAGVDTLSRSVDEYEQLAIEWIMNNEGSLRAQQTLLASLIDSRLHLAVFARIVRIKSEEAQRFGEALAILSSKTGTDHCMALLKITLKEQLDQTIELALLALEPLYEPGLVGTIRTGYASGDSRHIANACEALENLDKKGVTADLNDIIQKSLNNDFSHKNGFFRSASEVLDWCTEHRNILYELCKDPALQPLQT